MSGGAGDLQWVKERFAGGQAYRVIAPHICSAVTATLNRMYGVTGNKQKFPGAQPCSVMRDDLKALGSEHYVVAPKTDGTRYLMLVSGSAESRDMVFMIDRSMSIWIVPIFFREPVHVSRALFDGELVYDNKRGEWLYQIFDLIGCGTRFQPRDNYAKRMENARHLIQTELLTPAPGAPLPPMRVLVKRFYPTYRIDALLSDMERESGCSNDGLVFTPVPLGVRPFRNRRMFKWKKQTDHTVDFALLYNVHISQRAIATKQHLHDLSAPSMSTKQSASTADDDNDEQQVAEQYPQRVCVRLPGGASDELHALLADCVRIDARSALRPQRQQQRRESFSESTESGNEDNEDDDNGGADTLTISPDAIDYAAFEFHVIDVDKNMAYFGKVDANVNRDFLQRNSMSIANSARPMVVECAFENGVWRILLHRVDRELPNAEYTVEKTLQNISEDISLNEITDVVRNNTPPANSKHRKRARNESQPPRGERASRARHTSPALAGTEANVAAAAQHPMHTIHPSRAALFAPPPHAGAAVHHQPLVPEQSLPQPRLAHPMSKIHPSRLERFVSNAAVVDAMPPAMQSLVQSYQSPVSPPASSCEEYDPCNPAMDLPTKSTLAQKKADMSSLLRQLQKSIEKDPNSLFSSALQQPRASDRV